MNHKSSYAIFKVILFLLVISSSVFISKIVLAAPAACTRSLNITCIPANLNPRLSAYDIPPTNCDNNNDPEVTGWVAQQSDPTHDITQTGVTVTNPNTTQYPIEYDYVNLFCRIDVNKPYDMVTLDIQNTCQTEVKTCQADMPREGYLSNVNLNGTYYEAVGSPQVSGNCGSNCPTISGIANGDITETKPSYYEFSQPVGNAVCSRKACDRYWFSRRMFDINFPGPLTHTVTVTVSFNQIPINYWVSGTVPAGHQYSCVNSSGTASSLSAAEAICPSETEQFTITFNVSPPPPPPTNSFLVCPPSTEDCTNQVSFQAPIAGGLDNSYDTANITSEVVVQMSGKYNPLTVTFQHNYFSAQYSIYRANGTTQSLPSPPPTKVTYTSSTSGIGTDTMNVSASYPLNGNRQLVAGDAVCAQYTVTPASGSMNTSGNITSSTGVYTSPRSCQFVQNTPYVQFFGEDVLAGTAFTGTSCQINSNTPGITTSGALSSTGAGWLGSGSQFSTLSLGTISGYASAFIRTLKPTSANGLTFANNQSTPGNFGPQCNNVYNYITQRNVPNAPPTPIPSGGIVDVGPTYNHPDGRWFCVLKRNSNPPPPCDFNAPPPYPYITVEESKPITDRHMVYYLGNAYIPANLYYTTFQGKYNTSVQPGVEGIPGLYLVVIGNIYINGAVSHLDGNFIAENSCEAGILTNCSQSMISNCNTGKNACTGGTIYDCVNGAKGANPTAPVSPQNLYNTCDTQLTVTGTFVADHIVLDRTYDSIRDANTCEYPWAGNSHNCSTSNAAEVFDYDPVNLMNGTTMDKQSVTPESIISLPPVL